MNDRESNASHAPRRPSRTRALVLLKGLWRPLIVILLIAAVAWIVQPARLVSEIADLREWIDALGPWSIALFLLIYVIAAIAIVPAALLKVAAGGLFGSVLGLIVASVGSTLGAAACFLIARYVASGSLVQRMKQRERYRELDDLTRRHGAVIVALVRLVPILPGNLVNYAFGLTRVPLSVFVFWSWLCMLPGTVVLVVGTDAFVQGLDQDRVPWGMLAIVAGALALMGAAMYYAHRSFKLRQAQDHDELDYADL